MVHDPARRRPPETSVPWTLVRARGDDAATFLQGQLSCDVTSLVSGDSARGLVLTPAGDVVTSLWCHYHPDGVDLVVRSEVLDQTLSTLAPLPYAHQMHF